MMMVAAVMASHLRGDLLRVLLYRAVILLRGLQISRLQVLSQLGERLQDRIAAGLARVGNVLRKCGEVLLRLRQISGLQVLPQLLKFSFDLLKSGRSVLGGLSILRVVIQSCGK